MKHDPVVTFIGVVGVLGLIIFGPRVIDPARVDWGGLALALIVLGLIFVAPLGVLKLLILRDMSNSQADSFRCRLGFHDVVSLRIAIQDPIVTEYLAYCRRCRMRFTIHSYWGYRDVYPCPHSGFPIPEERSIVNLHGHGGEKIK